LYSTREITSNLSSAKMAAKRFASHMEREILFTYYNCYSGFTGDMASYSL